MYITLDCGSQINIPDSDAHRWFDAARHDAIIEAIATLDTMSAQGASAEAIQDRLHAMATAADSKKATVQHEAPLKQIAAHQETQEDRENRLGELLNRIDHGNHRQTEEELARDNRIAAELEKFGKR